MKKIVVILLVLSAYSTNGFCQNYFDINTNYRAILQTPGGNLPFTIYIRYFNNPAISSLPHFTISNGNETISNIFNVMPLTDSIKFVMPVFNTEIIAKLSEDANSLNGYWYDHSRPGNYYLPFHAEIHNNYRFKQNPLPPKQNMSGKWEALFKDESSTDSTVAIFEQAGNHLSGTFLTTTGDYRFLEGDVSADSFFLSTFDGSHAFLFKGKIHDDGTLTCDYWSGKHYYATINMKRNINAKLPDATSLTHLKPGFTKIDFSFPDENGNMVSINDTQFLNKPVVILITGSWCPNCMDEASYMSEVEDAYKNTSLKIVALAFERQTDSINFKKNIDRLKNHFGIDYPFLNAGSNKNASAALPMLDHIMGFPTTIILNKTHDVVEIYTGFSGPATGDLFLQYQKSFETLVNKLLD